MEFSKFIPECFRRERNNSVYNQEGATEHLRNLRPHGPGLMEFDVNWNLYHNDFESRQYMTSRSPDFWDTQMHILQQYMELSSPVDVPLGSQLRTGESGELMHFMHKHRNRNAFFTPEMIAEAVVDAPEVAVDYGEENGVEVWNFTTVNESNETEKLTLVRAGERPAIPTAPYLGITYVAEYDFVNERILFVPKFMMKWRDGINDALPRRVTSQLETHITTALGLEPQVIPQKLSFTVENEPFMFISLAETENPGEGEKARGDLGGFVMGQIKTPPYVTINLA